MDSSGIRGTYDNLEPREYSPRDPHHLEPPSALGKLGFEHREKRSDCGRWNEGTSIDLGGRQSELCVERGVVGESPSLVDSREDRKRNDRREDGEGYGEEEDVRDDGMERRVLRTDDGDRGINGCPGLPKSAMSTSHNRPLARRLWTYHHPASQPQRNPDERVPRNVPTGQISSALKPKRLETVERTECRCTSRPGQHAHQRGREHVQAERGAQKRDKR